MNAQSSSAVKPFKLQIRDRDIADLLERLRRTRGPDEPPLAPWSTVTSLAYMRGLVDYWEKRFDWRPWESKLNGWPQFTVPIGGIDLHFIHLRSGRAALYWFTGAIGSSFWPYYARMLGPCPVPEGKTVDVPSGYAEFPKEILSPPRSVAARSYTDIRRWSVMPKGGHFAALEQP